MERNNVMLVENCRTVVICVKKRLAWVLLTAILWAAVCPAPAAAEALLLLEEEAAVQIIRKVAALPAGTQGVTFRATVVWAGDDVIVQDSSGSLRLVSS